MVPKRRDVWDWMRYGIVSCFPFSNTGHAASLSVRLEETILNTQNWCLSCHAILVCQRLQCTTHGVVSNLLHDVLPWSVCVAQGLAVRVLRRRHLLHLFRRWSTIPRSGTLFLDGPVWAERSFAPACGNSTVADRGSPSSFDNVTVRALDLGSRFQAQWSGLVAHTRSAAVDFSQDPLPHSWRPPIRTELPLSSSQCATDPSDGSSTSCCGGPATHVEHSVPDADIFGRYHDMACSKRGRRYQTRRFGCCSPTCIFFDPLNALLRSPYAVLFRSILDYQVLLVLG